MSSWCIPNWEGISPVRRSLDHCSGGKEVPGYEDMTFILRASHVSKGEEVAFSAQKGRDGLSNNHHKNAV